MRLQRRAAANRLDGGDLLIYSSLVYYGSLRAVNATLRCVVDRKKTRIEHAYPYIAAHAISLAVRSESADQGYRP